MRTKKGGKSSLGLHGTEASLGSKPGEGITYKYATREERESRYPESDG